ncbi:MAG: hypothetical protein JNJ61_08670 [Anaerolineae bacterium]|nr:hypothetical protein [Anaerolineae bacterium]
MSLVHASQGRIKAALDCYIAAAHGDDHEDNIGCQDEYALDTRDLSPGHEQQQCQGVIDLLIQNFEITAAGQYRVEVSSYFRVAGDVAVRIVRE